MIYWRDLESGGEKQPLTYFDYLTSACGYPHSVWARPLCVLYFQIMWFLPNVIFPSSRKRKYQLVWLIIPSLLGTCLLVCWNSADFLPLQFHYTTWSLQVVLGRIVHPEWWLPGNLSKVVLCFVDDDQKYKSFSDTQENVPNNLFSSHHIKLSFWNVVVCKISNMSSLELFRPESSHA